ncbi:MAG: 2-oxo-hepta-3-ene-1,7-dioic acid hydratase [Paracoccaceae bacterium]
MLTRDEIEQAADDLVRAEAGRRQIGLLSRRHPAMTMDDAYAVQAAFVGAKLATGRRVIGWKIGLTSKAMQSALNIDTPDSGVLLDDMAFDSGATIPADRFIQPRIEAELAFVMKAPLGGTDTSLGDVLAAMDYVIPALEILDTRIVRVDPETKAARTIVDTISDNAANAGIVTGGRRVKPGEVDLRWCGAIVSRNGEVEETGLGAGVLNDPAMGIVWLANRLALYGQRIEAGQIVLSGSFIRPVEARHGDRIMADFGPLGHVGCDFA